MSEPNYTEISQDPLKVYVFIVKHLNNKPSTIVHFTHDARTQITLASTITEKFQETASQLEIIAVTAKDRQAVLLERIIRCIKAKYV